MSGSELAVFMWCIFALAGIGLCIDSQRKKLKRFIIYKKQYQEYQDHLRFVKSLNE